MTYSEPSLVANDRYPVSFPFLFWMTISSSGCHADDHSQPMTGQEYSLITCHSDLPDIITGHAVVLQLCIPSMACAVWEWGRVGTPCPGPGWGGERVHLSYHLTGVPPLLPPSGKDQDREYPPLPHLARTRTGSTPTPSPCPGLGQGVPTLPLHPLVDRETHACKNITFPSYYVRKR